MAEIKKTTQRKKTDSKTGKFTVIEAAKKKNASILKVLNSTCGTTHLIWKSPLPIPVMGRFVNIGICSINVEISGLGIPTSFKIPSRAGFPGTVLGHPLATKIEIECLPNVPGGDCRVMIALLW